MLRQLKILVASSLLALGFGCFFAAPGDAPPPGVVVPAGVVYVQPSYPMPAPGYVWEYHAHYGWGWHHPHKGWHKGWH